MSEQPVGTVIHYYPKINVAGIEVVSGHLEVGDTIEIEGHTTGFTQTIESMQIDHETVERASAGDEIGIQVAERVRVGDKVFRVTQQ